jgi:hypothetical protein
LRGVRLYILLVGLPLLGILEVLHIGKHLKPPIFLGGTWSIQVSRETANVRSCGDRFDGVPLNVSQSGASLILTLGDEQKTILAGEIHDSFIVAESLHQSVDKGLAADDPGSIRFQAEVDQPDRLQGVLKLTNCPALKGLPFTATRLSISKE